MAGKATDDERREAQRAYKREYRQKNAERIAAYRAAYNAQNRDKVLQGKRDAARRQSERRRNERERRKRVRERARRWSQDNPDKTREYRQRYREQHPDKVRQWERAYYHRNSESRRAAAREWAERNPEHKAEGMRRWQQANREPLREYQRRYRAENPEVYERAKAASREAARRARRLKELGLPPKRVRRVKAADRLRNDQTATDFFTRQRSPVERPRIMHDYQPTPPELLADWKRRSALARVRSDAMARFPRQLEEYQRKHGERLRDEARLDSTARTLRGAPPLDLDAEVHRRAFEAVWRGTAGLGKPVADIQPASYRPRRAAKVPSRDMTREP